MNNTIPFRRPAPLSQAAHRVITDDGIIWHLNRAQMTDRGLMRERMAHDIRNMLRDRGPDAVLITDDFLAIGWTRAQVELHYRAAFSLLKGHIAASAAPVCA